MARKQNYHGRWEALIKQSTEVLNAMFLLAGKNLRNYIIDQVSGHGLHNLYLLYL